MRANSPLRLADCVTAGSTGCNDTPHCGRLCGVVMYPRTVIRWIRLGIVACLAMWLVLAVLTFMGVFGSPVPITMVGVTVFGWIPALLLFLSLISYYRSIRQYVKQMDFLVCPKCGYDLHGCDSFGSCPECGRPYARDKLPLDWHRGGFAPPTMQFWKFYRRR
jgi:hypothetical protein